MRNALAYAGKTQRRIVSAWIGTAVAQDDAAAAKKTMRTVCLSRLTTRYRPSVQDLVFIAALGIATTCANERQESHDKTMAQCFDIPKLSNTFRNGP